MLLNVLVIIVTATENSIYSNYALNVGQKLTLTVTKQVMLGWCFFYIFANSLIFSPTEGYRLQFSIPCTYFVYTVRHCIGQHCSSMYAYTYRLFVVMWCHMVSVITTLLHCEEYFSSSSVVSVSYTHLTLPTNREV